MCVYHYIDFGCLIIVHFLALSVLYSVLYFIRLDEWTDSVFYIYMCSILGLYS